VTDTLDALAPVGSVAGRVRKRAAWWWTGVRPAVLRVHFYAGVFVGPFVLVAAITGLLYTVAPQLERMVHHNALTAPVGATRVDLAQQVVAAAAVVPGRAVTEIRPPTTPDGTTRVSFAVKGLPTGYARTAFVDPYTGRVEDVLDTKGEWLPLRAALDGLHRNLLLGAVGRVYSELAATWLGVLTVSGLLLWIARKRRRARLRRTLLPERSRRGLVRWRSWHAVLGLWTALGLVGLAGTGLSESQFAGAGVTAVRTSLDWVAPVVSTELPGAPADQAPTSTDPVATGQTAALVLGAARHAGLTDPVAIRPAGPGTAWTVTQVQRSWPEKQDSVAVDPATGAVVDTVRFADWPLSAKLARWGIDAHAGILFGPVNQIVLAALAIALIVMIGAGYRMWWLRVAGHTGFGAPGGRLRASPGALMVGLLVAVGASLYAPLLGVSLVAFLVVDLANRRISARRPRSR
jgi:uncharacterized iron-regulated membrane protein